MVYRLQTHYNRLRTCIKISIYNSNVDEYKEKIAEKSNELSS